MLRFLHVGLYTHILSFPGLHTHMLSFPGLHTHMLSTMDKVPVPVHVVYKSHYGCMVLHEATDIKKNA